MFILNQIPGIGDFSIADNLRLIVIAAIFIGIIVVLLYRKSAKNGRKAKKKNMQPANSHGSSSGSSSKEKGSFVDEEDDFLGIEEETEESSVASHGKKEVADIEDRERRNDTRQEAGIEDVRAELTIKIEGLVSKIEEREKEVLRKVENVVDARVQEVLSKINDRIDEVLHAQENATALVLEKIMSSLPQKEAPVFNKIQETIEGKDAASKTLGIKEKSIGIESPAQSKTVVGEKAEFEEITERDLEVPDESGDIEVVAEVSEKTKEEDLGILPSEDEEDIKTEKEEQIDSSERVEEKVSGKAEGDSADFDIQKFLDELENLPSENDPEAEK